MSLEFPRIVSLQIQVKTKDFKSWIIHYWNYTFNRMVGVHENAMLCPDAQLWMTLSLIQQLLYYLC